MKKNKLTKKAILEVINNDRFAAALRNNRVDLESIHFKPRPERKPDQIYFGRDSYISFRYKGSRYTYGRYKTIWYGSDISFLSDRQTFNELYLKYLETKNNKNHDQIPEG